MPRIGLDFALDSLGGGLGGVNCDFTTFYNGVSLVNDPFVNGSPVTGPIRIDTENNEDDAIVSDGISYKFDVDDFFNQKFSFDQPTSGVERTYIFTSAGNADVALIIPTNLIPYLEVDNGTTTIQLTSSTAVVQGQVYNIKFVTAGIESNKSFTLFMDGIEVSGAQFIDMSGVTLNKLTLGTKEDFTDRLSMSLYEIDSNQIGYTDFISRLPDQNDLNGNKFFSTTGVTYTLFPQTPLTEYYPYYGLGFGWPDAYYVSDTYCGDCNVSTYWNGTSFVSFGFTGLPASPSIGVTKLTTNYYTTTGLNIDYINGFADTFRVKFTTGTPNNARVFSIGVDGNDAIFAFYDTSLDRIRLNSTVGGVNNLVNTLNNIIFEEVWHTFAIDINYGDPLNAKTVTLVISDDNGVLSTLVDTVDFTLGKNVTHVNIGADIVGSNISTMEVDYHNSDKTGNANYDTRLKARDDVDIEAIITTTDVKFYPSVGGDLSSIYPYYTSLDTLTPGRTTVVEFQGDSITTPLIGEWPQFLMNYYTDNGVTDIDWNDRAVSGKTSASYAPTGFPSGDYTPNIPPETDKNITFSLAQNPDVVIWFLGQNDNTQGFTEAHTLDILDAVIADCATAGVPLIVFTIMPRELVNSTAGQITWANNVSAGVRSRVSAPNKLVDINVLVAVEGSSPNVLDLALASDGIHLSGNGEVLAAEGNAAKVDDAYRGVIDRIKEMFSFQPYLSSDTLCAGNNLVTNDGIAVTNNGEFVINTP